MATKDNQKSALPEGPAGTEVIGKNNQLPVNTPVTEMQTSIPALSGAEQIVESPGQQKEDEISVYQSTAAALKQMLDQDIVSLQNPILPAFSDTEQGKQAFSDLQAAKPIPTELSLAEGQQISYAGQKAAEPFKALIKDAIEKGQKGKAAGLIAAAKAGGLDTSAFVGISALAGAEATGAEGFQGTGGLIAQQAAEYDRNIADLQSRQMLARQAAEQAERQAIITGKRADFDRALQLYETAKSAYNDRINLQLQKQNLLNTITSRVKTGSEFLSNIEADRANSIAGASLFLDDEGNVVAPTKEEIEALAAEQGVDPFDLQSAINDQIQTLEKFSADQKQAYLEAQKTQIESAGKIADIGKTEAETAKIGAQTEGIVFDTGTIKPLEAEKIAAQIEQIKAATKKTLKSLTTSVSSGQASVAEQVAFLQKGGNIKDLPIKERDEAVNAYVNTALGSFEQWIGNTKDINYEPTQEELNIYASEYIDAQRNIASQIQGLISDTDDDDDWAEIPDIF